MYKYYDYYDSWVRGVVWWMVLEKEHVWTGAMLVFLLAVTKE